MREIRQDGVQRDPGRERLCKHGIEYGNDGNDATKLWLFRPVSAKGVTETRKSDRPEQRESGMHEFNGGHGVVGEKKVVEPVTRRDARDGCRVYQFDGRRCWMKLVEYCSYSGGGCFVTTTSIAVHEMDTTTPRAWGT